MDQTSESRRELRRVHAKGLLSDNATCLAWERIAQAGEVLDSFFEGRPYSQEAWEVLRCCNDDGDMGLVTSGSLKDVNFVLNRGGSEAAAREVIDMLMELLVIAPIGAEECELSLHTCEPDFGDCLTCVVAEFNDVDFTLTWDSHAFKR